MPAILVIAIGVVSAVVLSKNANAGSHPLEVKVFAQQFAWKFEYPGNVQTEELVMPLHRVGRVRDAVGGRDPLALDPADGPEAGRRPGHHDEDRHHADADRAIHAHLHRALRPRPLDDARAGPRARAGRVRATGSRRSSAAGLARGRGRCGRRGGRRPVGRRATAALGKTTFASAGCGGCHAFTPAGTDAQIGPDLDGLVADAKKAGEPEDAYIKQSIVDPNAVIVSGYQSGVMPTTFGKTLSPEELDGLVAFLSGKEAK